MATRSEGEAVRGLPERLLGIVAGAAPLAPSPAGARQVRALPRRPREADLKRVAASDPVLASVLLARAASARDHDGCSLGAAVTALGPAEAHRALVDASCRAEKAPGGPLGDYARRAWRESLGVGVLAQALCHLRGLDSEQGFALGLLHDLGKAAASAAANGLAAGSGPPPFEDDWAAMADRLHVEAGVLCAERVGLPPCVRRVLAGHHDPAGEEGPWGALLAAVASADAIVERLGGAGAMAERDLVGVPGIRSSEERETIAALLGRVAVVADALEAAACAPALEARHGCRAPVDATLELGEERILGQAESLEERGLVVRTPSALPAGAMVVALLHDDEDELGFTGLVTRTWGDRRGWHAWIAVAALRGDAGTSWASFVAARRRGA